MGGGVRGEGAGGALSYQKPLFYLTIKQQNVQLLTNRNTDTSLTQP